MTIIAIVLGIGVMVFIHELGHFIAAKSLKIQVDDFSIGFGPALLNIKKGGTNYKISLIPLGGYVKMKGDNPSEELQGTDDEFLSRKTHEKIYVALLGPLFNILLAVIIYIFMFSIMGIPKTLTPENAQIVHIENDSPAYASELQKEDIIRKLDGIIIERPDQVIKKIINSEGRKLQFEIERDGDLLFKSITPEKRSSPIGIDYHYIGVTFKTEPVLGKMPARSNAYKSGLRKGDRILSVNGERIISLDEVLPYADKGAAVELQVQRGQETMNVVLEPVLQSGIMEGGKIRKAYAFDIVQYYDVIRYPVFFEGLSRTFKEIGMDFTLIYFSLKLIIKQPKQAKNLGGPITIGYILSESFKRSFGEYLKWIAMISVNLTVVNLLPLMITDGGLILVFLFEGVSKRKMKKKEREVFSMVGYGLLISLFLFIIFNDISRFL